MIERQQCRPSNREAVARARRSPVHPGARLVSAIPECPNCLARVSWQILKGAGSLLGHRLGRESRAGGEYALDRVLRDDPVREGADDGCGAV
jgi:hypothetical protein